MRPEHDNLVVHEGLTELEQMKFGMLKTVLRCVMYVVIGIVSFALIFSLILLMLSL